MKTKTVLIAAFLFSPFCLLADTTQAAPGTIETWISFLPVILFLFILFMTIIKLRNDKTKLSDLLIDKDNPAVPAAAPVAVAAAAPAGGPAPAAAPAPSQSVSRFIAFLTGLIALTIGVCVCTFYMYSYFSNPGKAIDISNLTNVIWGLGIGVIPYGANKVSSALKSNT